jgi:splicing factor U2AF subunit
MNRRTLTVATAVGLACLTLAGCVSDGGTYSSNNRVYDRGDHPNVPWARRNRDHHHDRDRNDSRLDRN